MFYFQGAAIPGKCDLANRQNTPEGPLKLVLIGRVEGFDLHLNESAFQWSTGSRQIFGSTNPKATDNFAVEFNVFVNSPDYVS